MTIFEKISEDISKDPMNKSYTIRGIKPLFKASKEARIAIVGQAPGRKAEETRYSTLFKLDKVYVCL